MFVEIVQKGCFTATDITLNYYCEGSAFFAFSTNQIVGHIQDESSYKDYKLIMKIIQELFQESDLKCLELPL